MLCRMPAGFALMMWASRSLRRRHTQPSPYPQHRAAMSKLRSGRLTMEYSDDGEASSARHSGTGAATSADGVGADPGCAALVHVVAEGAGGEAAGLQGQPPTEGKQHAQHRPSLASALAALALDLQQQLAALEGEVPLRQQYGKRQQHQEEQQAERTERGTLPADAQHGSAPRGSPGLLGLAGPGRGAARQQLGAPPAWPPLPAHVVARARAASAAARAAEQQAAAPGAPPAGADKLLLERNASLRRMSSVLRRLSTVLMPSRAARSSGSSDEVAAAQQPPLWRDSMAGGASEADARQSGALRRFSTALRRFSAALLLPRQRLSDSSTGSTGSGSAASSAEPGPQQAPTWRENEAAGRNSTVQTAGTQSTLRRMSSVARRLFTANPLGQQAPMVVGSQPAAAVPTERDRPPLRMSTVLRAAGSPVPALGSAAAPSAAAPMEPPSWRNNNAASRASMLVAEERDVLRMSSVLRRLSSALLPSWMRLPDDSSAGDGAVPAAGRQSGLRRTDAPLPSPPG